MAKKKTKKPFRWESSYNFVVMSFVVVALAFIFGNSNILSQAQKLDATPALTVSASSSASATSSKAPIPTQVTNYINPDPIINCNVSTNCGGGTKTVKKSVCSTSTCCEIGDRWVWYESSSKCIEDQQRDAQLRGTKVITGVPSTQSKTPVFISYGGYTVYCPSQNVGAVMSINSTMESKKNQWATDYNTCTNNFQQYDSCYVSCESTMKSDWNICTTIYGYTGDSYTQCTKEVSDNYGTCISQCPSTATHCDYVYAEQKSLSSQISNLCK